MAVSSHPLERIGAMGIRVKGNHPNPSWNRSRQASLRGKVQPLGRVTQLASRHGDHQFVGPSSLLSSRQFEEPHEFPDLGGEMSWGAGDLQTIRRSVATIRPPPVQTHLQHHAQLRRAPLLRAVAFGAAKCQGLRPYMEDRHCIVGSLSTDNLAAPHNASSALVVAPGSDGHLHQSFAAVFDGHCGSAAADLAAARMHQLLAESPTLRIAQDITPASAAARAEEYLVKAALRRAFKETEAEILGRAREQRPELSAGTTALVMLHRNGSLYTAHTGDSRAVLCRGSRAMRLTEDHKPNHPAERERIESQGGRVEYVRGWRVFGQGRPGGPARGLNMSRSLGDLSFKEPARLIEAEPDVRRVELQAEDAFVILGSDGLWGTVPEQEAIDIVSQVLADECATPDNLDHCLGAAHSAADQLVSLALDNGSTDNITAVVMLLNWDHARVVEVEQQQEEVFVGVPASMYDACY